MPKKKRKRTQEEYDKEILEAVKRMKKHPEYLKSAKNSSVWNDFLESIDIHIETEAKGDFFEEVRQAINPTPVVEQPKRRITDYKKIEYKRALVKPSLVYRDKKGRFTKTRTMKAVVSYKDELTNRYIGYSEADKKLGEMKQYS